jgi:penicillin amidase
MRLTELLPALATAAIGRIFPIPPRRPRILKIPGLEAEAEVRWDAWGVPHVYAASQHDAFLTQGYLHAGDRLWQMELNRRIGSGRLSEVFGERTVEADRFLRRVGLHRAAATEQALLEGEAREMMEAYCAGVNAWLGSHRRLPLEFALLGFHPERWRPVDCLQWAKLMGWGLALNWDVELFRANLRRHVSEETAQAVDWPYPREHPLTIEHAHLPAGGGSNAWVIGGDRMESGRPMLANDPHLVPQMPSAWYEVYLECPEFRAAGASLPGAPGIVIGHNERIAWGMTASMVDTQDLFEERFEGGRYRTPAGLVTPEVVRESIDVKGRSEPFFEEVFITRHGPVIMPAGASHGAYALRTTLIDPGSVPEAALRLLKAGGWQDVRSALELWASPSVNFMYADVDGNIGYQLAGVTPRRPEDSGVLPAPGWTDDFEWDGYLTLDELPHSLNPASGFLVNANNKPGPDGPAYIAGEWVDGYRAGRIAQLIQAQERLSLEDIQAMHMDSLSLPAQEFLEAIGAARDANRAPTVREGTIANHPATSLAQKALQLLQSWDGRMLTESPGAAVYAALRARLYRQLVETRLGEGSEAYFNANVHPLSSTSSYQFRGTSGFLQMLREADLATILDEALIEAVRDLGPDPKRWRWGSLHRTLFRHPMGTVRGLGWLLNRGPYEVPGDGDTVHQASYGSRTPFEANRWLPTYRFIADTNDWDRSLSVHVPGQSGIPGSRHYADQVPLWQDGRYHPMPFSRKAVEAATRSSQKLLPDS